MEPEGALHGDRAVFSAMERRRRAAFSKCYAGKPHYGLCGTDVSPYWPCWAPCTDGAIRLIRAAVYLAFGGLIYALGASTPVHKLLYTALPMLDKARNPVRGLFLVAFAVSWLAAFGTQAFLAGESRVRRAALPVILVLAGALVLVHSSGLLIEMYPILPSH